MKRNIQIVSGLFLAALVFLGTGSLINTEMVYIRDTTVVARTDPKLKIRGSSQTGNWFEIVDGDTLKFAIPATGIIPSAYLTGAGGGGNIYSSVTPTGNEIAIFADSTGTNLTTSSGASISSGEITASATTVSRFRRGGITNLLTGAATYTCNGAGKATVTNSSNTTITITDYQSTGWQIWEIDVTGDASHTLAFSGPAITARDPATTPATPVSGLSTFRFEQVAGKIYLDVFQPYATPAAFSSVSVNDLAYDATTWNGSTNVATQNAIRDKIEASVANSYTMQLSCPNSFNPADGATYYFGASEGFGIGNLTTFTNASVRIPKTGTLVSVHFQININSVAGTASENVVHTLDINAGATSVALGTFDYNPTVRKTLVSGLTQAVTAGDYVALKIVCPTWTTNPTGLGVYCLLEIE